MLKTIVTDIETVDEAQRAFYKETEGKDGKLFVLQLVGVDEHPDVKALKNAFETQKTTNTDLRSKKEAAEKALERFEGLPEDFSTTTYEDLKARAEKGGNAPDAEEVERTIAARVQKAEEKAAEKLKTAEIERDKFKSRFESTIVDTQLTNALIGAGVKDEAYLRASKAMLGGKLEIIADGENYSVIARDKFDTPMPAESFIKDWADSDEGKRFVGAPGSGGGGGSGGGSGGSGGKSISRAQFDQMAPAERSKKMSEGFTITD